MSATINRMATAKQMRAPTVRLVTTKVSNAVG